MIGVSSKHRSRNNCQVTRERQGDEPPVLRPIRTIRNRWLAPFRSTYFSIDANPEYFSTEPGFAR